MTENYEGWQDLTEGMLICELCSKYYTLEEFYEHLREHSKEEVLILKKLSEKTKNMTSEQYRKFLANLECESYARVRRAKKQSLHDMKGRFSSFRKVSILPFLLIKKTFSLPMTSRNNY